jgi:hypothetical protein
MLDRGHVAAEQPTLPVAERRGEAAGGLDVGGRAMKLTLAHYEVWCSLSPAR